MGQSLPSGAGLGIAAGSPPGTERTSYRNAGGVGMNLIRTMWDCGLWCTLEAVTRHVGRCISKLNPVRWLPGRAPIGKRHLRPALAWVPPRSRW
jgi:hypothetical protein